MINLAENFRQVFHKDNILSSVSCRGESFPWKQKQLYRSRNSSEKVSETGQKIFTVVVKSACWVSKEGFWGKENFLWKTFFIINTGFWAKYSHSCPNFFEGCRNFNLNVMRNVLRKKNFSEGKNPVFEISGSRAEKSCLLATIFWQGCENYTQPLRPKNWGNIFFSKKLHYSHIFRNLKKLVGVQKKTFFCQGCQNGIRWVH